MPKWKQEVITFKVDEELSKALKAIPNRSEFIRAAVQAALGSVCPICRGMGFLNEKQRYHWEVFAQDHRLEKCGQCQSHYLVCQCDGTHKPAHTDDISPSAAPPSAATRKNVADDHEEESTS